MILVGGVGDLEAEDLVGGVPPDGELTPSEEFTRAHDTGSLFHLLEFIVDPGESVELESESPSEELIVKTREKEAELCSNSITRDPDRFKDRSVAGESGVKEYEEMDDVHRLRFD